MNPVINSLTQSPFVREISHVKSKVGSYVHGMSDNVPPFAHHKVVVKPYNNPSKVTQAATHKFKIPQEGTLNRAYLRIKMINQIPIVQDILETDYNTFHDPTSTILTVDSNYAGFKTKHRIPWVHDTQTNSFFRRNQPFGSGGAQKLDPRTAINPEDMFPNNTAAGINYASRLEVIPPENYLGTASNGWNVINILDSITLKTGNKTIEHVHPETIPAEVVRMPQDLRDFYLRGMVGWSMGTETGVPLSEPDYRLPWDPTACRRDGYGRLETNKDENNQVIHVTNENLLNQPIILRNQHANFIVPVPLSSLKTLKKNYQTRFVEELELEIVTKELLRGFNEYLLTQDDTSRHEVELVLLYHNWHDNIESEIRRINYKPNIPASVYSTEWIRDGVTHVAVSDTQPLEIPIKSRQLITEMLIVTRSKSGFSTAPETWKRRKSDYTIFFQHAHMYKLSLVGGGRTLWEGTNVDLLGPDSADYDLVGRKLSGGDVAYGGIRNVKHAHALQGVSSCNASVGIGGRLTVSYKNPTQCGVDYSFGDNMAVLRFGLQTSDEFFSGGMALQTISNVKLIITPPADEFSAAHGAEHSSWVGREIEFEVYVKNVNMTHIDSKTGVITRSVDV